MALATGVKVFRLHWALESPTPAPTFQKLRLSWPRELCFLEAPMVGLKQVTGAQHFTKIPKKISPEQKEVGMRIEKSLKLFPIKVFLHTAKD